MKKLVLFGFFLVQIGLNAQTSVYHPMPDSAAKWCVTYVWGMCGAHDEYTLYMKGDTTIGAYQYHKLYASGLTYCQGPPSYYSNQYRGAFREDGSRKVYTVKQFLSTESLAYDFNWLVGDTVLSGPPFVVTSIDSILIGSTYRKRWWTNAYFGAAGGNGDASISMIEGIGSTAGIFCAIECQGVEEGSLLNGFMQNNLLDYNKNTGICNFGVGVKEYNVNMGVFPNPTTGILSIPENTKEIRITNSLGEIVDRKLYSQDLHNEIDISLFHAGIYFLTLNPPEGTITRKIIKQ